VIVMAVPPPRPTPRPKNIKIMKAIYDYQEQEPDELSFHAGDIVYVLDQTDDDWWRARCKGREGLVPSNHLEVASTDGSTSPLHDAAKRGNMDLLKECLLNRLPVNQTDSAGNTAIHWAARAGHIHCLQELLCVQQVQLNNKNKLGDTAIKLAATHGQALAVKALLEAGADTSNLGSVIDPEVSLVLAAWGGRKEAKGNYNDAEYEQMDSEEE